MNKLLFALMFIATLMGKVCCCSYPWTSYQNSCYLLVESQLNWFDSLDDCRAYGAGLVCIESPNEDDFVKSVISGTAGTWIGYRKKRLSNYVWSDGSVSAYENWADGEPSDAGGAEGCTVMRDIDGQWYDGNCFDLNSFVCEKLETSQAAEIQLQAAEEPSLTDILEEFCSDPQYKQFGDFCYYNSAVDELVTRDGARDQCLSLGMDLVSIHTQEENDFVEQFVEEVRGDDNTWIGLLQIGSSESDFEWSDGSDFDFDNWASEEPSNAEEECVVMKNDGTWNDVDCSGYELGYTCKTAKEILTTATPPTLPLTSITAQALLSTTGTKPSTTKTTPSFTTTMRQVITTYTTVATPPRTMAPTTSIQATSTTTPSFLATSRFTKTPSSATTTHSFATTTKLRGTEGTSFDSATPAETIITTTTKTAPTATSEKGNAARTITLTSTSKTTQGNNDSPNSADDGESVTSSVSPTTGMAVGKIAIIVGCLAFVVIIVAVIIFLTVAKRWTAILSKFKASSYATESYEL